MSVWCLEFGRWDMGQPSTGAFILAISSILTSSVFSLRHVLSQTSAWWMCPSSSESEGHASSFERRQNRSWFSFRFEFRLRQYRLDCKWSSASQLQASSISSWGTRIDWISASYPLGTSRTRLSFARTACKAVDCKMGLRFASRFRSILRMSCLLLIQFGLSQND